tara:strand:+ start:692 stop:1198 length:507 start_codon:yes stop_codon:yes gene_type:complete
MRIIILVLLLTGCQPMYTSVQNAEGKLGMNEKQNSRDLKEYVGVDPRYTEWCAAFVNAVLQESNIPNLHDINHPQPLTARSFLDWGESVDIPQAGDIVVFPRGKEGWQGHVGFYVGWEKHEDGKVYWKILGGNQSDSVSIELYRSTKALGIRRYKYNYEILGDNRSQG